MSVCYSIFSWLFVFLYFGFGYFLFGRGKKGEGGLVEVKGLVFSNYNDICYKGLRTETA